MVSVRIATIADAELFFRIKNDPVTRQFSIVTKDQIAWADHYQWMLEKLSDPNWRIYVICFDDLPVGNIRLIQQGNLVEVALGIDAPHRRKGFANFGLNALLDRSTNYVAKIVEGNIASMRLFLELGFRIEGYEKGVYYFYR